MENKEEKKQIPLRLSPKLYNAIAQWAADDFRSVNGQIEYLLTECVRTRTSSHTHTNAAPSINPNPPINPEK